MEIISGKNAVLEAIKSDLSINRILIAENINEHFARSIIQLCHEKQIPIRHIPKNKLDKITGGDHRGIAAELAAFSYVEIHDIIEAAKKQGEEPLIVLLDGIEDPHNLGAIVRSAYCLGAHGLIIGKRRAAPLNQTVMKTSAGAAALLPIARVNNLNQSVELFKKIGFWIIAVDITGENLWESTFEGPLVLVLGSEGKGISTLLKRNCDLQISIPMKNKEINSLNVSNAAAIILSEISRQRST